MALDRIPPARLLTEEETKMVLSWQYEDINIKLIKKYFSTTKSHELVFNSYDVFTIPANYLYNEKPIRTTVGRYIFNIKIFEKDLIKMIGFQNYPMNSGGLGKSKDIISKLLLEDKIDSHRYVRYLDNENWLYQLVKYFGSAITLDLVKPTPKAQAKKEELLEKYKDDIENNDFIKFSEVENEVLKVAKSEVENTNDFEIYESGASGKLNNSFKNTTYFRGAIRNLADESKYYVSTESLLDGIPPEEMPYYADIITQSAYGRAVGTRQGGYVYKQLAAAFQGLVLDDAGTDCGTNRTIEMVLDKDTAKLLEYRYIVEDGKLVRLDSENMKNYIGQKIHLRSPMYCKGDKYCNKCCGDLYYMIDDLKTVGLVINRVGTSLLNASLKAFHDLSLKIMHPNIEDYIN